MGLIETMKQRPLLVIFVIAIVGLGLFSGIMLSIFEEGKYVSLRPVDGSEVQGLEQEITVTIKIENFHTVIISGEQKPYLAVTGLNTTYQWNQTPSISYGGAVQTIIYHEKHMFPGFGFYKLTARVYYLYNGNVSDVRMIDETSIFKIVEVPVIPDEIDTTTTDTTPIVESEPDSIAGMLSKGLGVIVLIAGVVAIYFFYLRKRYKLP